MKEANPGKMADSNHSLLPEKELKHCLNQGLAIMDQAEDVLLKAKKRGFATRVKADRSFVTDVDIEVESVIRERIEQAFPDHDVLGEELSDKNHTTDFQWIIDPIDGTRSFLHHIPLYGTILALRFQGESVLGIINLPELKIRVHGARGLGAFCGSRALDLSDNDNTIPVREGIIAVGDRQQFINSGKAHVFDSLIKSHACVRTYSDCFGHVLTLQGMVGAMVDFDLKSWDMAATEILIHEAGGKFVTLNSRTTQGAVRSCDVVFGRPHVVDWIIDTIS
jgi:histidinol-phosphatase